MMLICASSPTPRTVVAPRSRHSPGAPAPAVQATGASPAAAARLRWRIDRRELGRRARWGWLPLARAPPRGMLDARGQVQAQIAIEVRGAGVKWGTWRVLGVALPCVTLFFAYGGAVAILPKSPVLKTCAIVAKAACRACLYYADSRLLPAEGTYRANESELQKSSSASVAVNLEA